MPSMSVDIIRLTRPSRLPSSKRGDVRGEGQNCRYALAPKIQCQKPVDLYEHSTVILDDYSFELSNFPRVRK